jgi:hypothetical protein
MRRIVAAFCQSSLRRRCVWHEVDDVDDEVRREIERQQFNREAKEETSTS